MEVRFRIDLNTLNLKENDWLKAVYFKACAHQNDSERPV